MSDKEVLKKILKRYLKNNSKKTIYTILIFWVILAWISILEPFFLKEIISIIEQYIKTREFNLELLIEIFIFWWLFILLVTFCRVIYEKKVSNTNLNNYKLNHLKETEKLLWMDYWEYLSKKQWKLFKIYDRWIEAQLEIVYFIFEELIFAFFWVFFTIIILFIINVKMAIISLILLPIVIYIGHSFNLKTRNIQKNIDNKWDESFWYFWDGINNLWLLKILWIKKIITNLIKKNVNKAHNQQQKVIYRWIVADVYTQFVLMFARFLVLSFWIYFLVNDKIDFATLFLFMAYIPQIYYPIWFIFKRLQTIQKQLTGVRKFYEEFDSILIEDEKKWDKLKNISWNIKFKNVTFNYTKDKNIFKKLSFKINSGEKIAFVGNTWVGKSTIVNLLFRFWDVNSGQILIDWQNITNISKESLRQNIWLVMQDNSLFNTSIKENLKFANPKASLKDITKALKNAEAHFVFKLKDWINTKIWERGLKLSWWEKQRLSIARLFLKNPKILILDEATSALDNKTEKLVQRALDKLTNWRTSIVIAHRLSTIQNADKIFMLENWKIVEEGNYKELIKKKKKFFKLANPDHLLLN